jgi:transcriptional regulator with PAS, ATPase and Fis domain
VIPIWLPPLRERKEDIPVLVEYFAEKICKDLERDSIILEKEAMHALIQYDWPGNVRELENIMERTIILLDGDVIRLGHIPSYVVGNHQENLKKSVESLITEMDHELTFEEYEKIIIKKALKKHGSYNKAGKALGLTHNTVAAKARKFDIRFEDLID